MAEGNGNIIDLGAAREESEAEADPVGTLHKALVEQNTRAIGQLELLGVTVPRVLFVQAALEALIDIVFDTPEALAEFHLASDTCLNAHLLTMLKRYEH